MWSTPSTLAARELHAVPVDPTQAPNPYLGILGSGSAISAAVTYSTGTHTTCCLTYVCGASGVASIHPVSLSMVHTTTPASTSASRSLPTALRSPPLARKPAASAWRETLARPTAQRTAPPKRRPARLTAATAISVEVSLRVAAFGALVVSLVVSAAGWRLSCFAVRMSLR